MKLTNLRLSLKKLAQLLPLNNYGLRALIISEERVCGYPQARFLFGFFTRALYTIKKSVL